MTATKNNLFISSLENVICQIDGWLFITHIFTDSRWCTMPSTWNGTKPRCMGWSRKAPSNANTVLWFSNKIYHLLSISTVNTDNKSTYERATVVIILEWNIKEKKITWTWKLKTSDSKVRIFWEGHKILKDLPVKIWRRWVASNFTWKIFSNFVAFSEYPNFTIRRFQLRCSVFSYSLLSLIKPVIHNCCLFLFFQKKYGWKSMER